MMFIYFSGSSLRATQSKSKQVDYLFHTPDLQIFEDSCNVPSQASGPTPVYQVASFSS